MKTLLAAVFAIILISACVSDSYRYDFAGQKMSFRANLQEASKVPVYPEESAVKQVLLSPSVQKVWVAYVPNDEENGFFSVSSFEVGYKLTIIYKYYFGREKPIESLALNSTEGLKASENEPVILFITPKSGAKQTAVTVENNIIRLEGKDMGEVNRQYTDLDMAIDKMLLVLMR